MTRNFLSPMPAEIVANQHKASDPAFSVWVSANAGSGKTHVLTARVLRLLLAGVRPDEILCLTYTKAAAAEMRSRVGERLGIWTELSEPDLIDNLTKLTGGAPGAATLLRARSLFAHALETPGGLRIQTIHAFCESVLHRFPKEAGVPFDFTRDRRFRARRDAARSARARTSPRASAARGEAAAVETLFGLLSDFQIEQAITEAPRQAAKARSACWRGATTPSAICAASSAMPGPSRTCSAEIANGYPLTAGGARRVFCAVAARSVWHQLRG